MRDVLILLLFILKVSKSSVIPSRPYRRADESNDVNSQTAKDMHNATVHCRSSTILKNLWRCQRDIFMVVGNSYPSVPYGRQVNSRLSHNLTDSTLTDALDSLNHVCHTHERSHTCLKESGIRDYCLTVTTHNLYLQMDFQLSVINGAMRT